MRKSFVDTPVPFEVITTFVKDEPVSPFMFVILKELLIVASSVRIPLAPLDGTYI